MASTTTLPSIDIARHILWLRQGERTTHLHLQKLLYFCHGWTLGYYGAPLMHEFEFAWEYGPVEPALYQRYKDCVAEPIEEPSATAADLDPELAQFIRGVETAYRSYGPWDLVRITHEPGSPWFKTVTQFGYGAVIENDLMREFFAPPATS